MSSNPTKPESNTEKIEKKLNECQQNSVWLESRWKKYREFFEVLEAVSFFSPLSR